MAGASSRDPRLPNLLVGIALAVALVRAPGARATESSVTSAGSVVRRRRRRPVRLFAPPRPPLVGQGLRHDRPRRDVGSAGHAGDSFGPGAIRFDPNHRGHVYAPIGQGKHCQPPGIVRSTDGGATWRAWSRQPCYVVDLLFGGDGAIFARTEYTFTAFDVVYRTSDDGRDVDTPAGRGGAREGAERGARSPCGADLRSRLGSGRAGWQRGRALDGRRRLVDDAGDDSRLDLVDRRRSPGARDPLRASRDVPADDGGAAPVDGRRCDVGRGDHRARDPAGARSSSTRGRVRPTRSARRACTGRATAETAGPGSIVPFGGRLSKLTVDPSSATLYAATGSGLFTSSDEGDSWTQLIVSGDHEVPGVPPRHRRRSGWGALPDRADPRPLGARGRHRRPHLRRPTRRAVRRSPKRSRPGSRP